MNNIRQSLKRLLKTRTVAIISIIGIFSCTLLFIERKARPRIPSQSEAQANLLRSREELARANRTTDSALKLVDRAGVTNSIVGDAVNTWTSNKIMHLEREVTMAHFDAVIARRYEVADYCLEVFEDAAKADRAVIAIELAGIEDVVLHSDTPRKDPHAKFELRVPRRSVANAVTALKEIEVCELLRIPDGSIAVAHLSTIKEKGIPATIRIASGNSSTNSYVIYVRRSDLDLARTLITRR